MAPLRQRRIWLACAGALCASAPAQAQIATDGTLGAAQAFTGTHSTIPASLGKQAGGNLFHSFGQFNVPTGGSATFAGPASGPAVSNVISRVTGGQASFVDGLLRSTIANANLFLINPRGIVFGPGASLDLTGSFHASTAHYLKLADGTRFEATATVNPILTAAAPAAFGFLGPTGPINVRQGSLQLATPGRSLSLVGGPVNVSGASLGTAAGDLQLVGTAGAGEVTLAGAPTPGLALAPVTIQRSTLATASAPAANGEPGLAPGRLLIRGGQLTVFDTTLTSTNGEAADAPPVTLAASGDLTVTAGTIRSETTWTGRGADVVLGGENVTIDHNSRVGSVTQDEGRGGDVAISARGAARIVAAPEDPNYTKVYSETHWRGDGGTIRLQGDTVSVESAVVDSRTTAFGRGGPVVIDARDVLLMDGAFVASQARPGATGAGGNIEIRAANRFVNAGADWTGFPSYLLAATEGTGAGGAVLIQARDVLLSGGFIESTTQRGGNAGAVTLDAQTIRLEVGGPFGYIAAITSLSGRNATGSGGALTLRASGSVTVDGFGINPFAGTFDPTFVTAQNIGPGRGGSILVESPLVVVDNGASIVTAGFGSGDLGSVVIRAHDVTIVRDGVVRSARQPGATGRSGSILIEGTGRLRVGSDFPDNAAIATRDSGPTAGGSITITIPDVELSGGGEITSTARGFGDGGAITINAARLKLTGGYIISDALANGLTPTASPGGAGAITLNLGESFVVSGPFGAIGNNGLVSSISSGAGASGGIVVAAPHILLDSGVIQAGNIGSGRGGRIEVRANDLFMRNGSQITTGNEPSATGPAGSVRVDVAGRLEICCGVGWAGQEAGLSATTRGPGPGGDISVTAGTLFIDDRGFIISSTEGAGVGDAGRIDVRAGSVDVRNGGAIRAKSFGPGAAGAIRVTATDLLQVSRDGAIDTESFGGDGGSITLTAPRIVIVDEGRVVASATGAGAAGQIEIRATEDLRVENGSVLSGTAGTGAGGRILLTAPRIAIVRLSPVAALSVGDGAAGRIDIDAGEVLRVEQSLVTTQALGRGAGGQIALRAPVIDIAGGTVSASSEGDGAAGRIDIDAGSSLRIAGTVASSTSAGGAGGQVSLRSPMIDIAGGTVSASSEGDGPAGRIDIGAGDSLRIAGTVASSTSAGGAGGQILLTAPRIGLVGGGKVAATSTGIGEAGRIDIRATDALRVFGGSTISTNARSSDGGNIDIRVGNLVHLRDSEITTAVGSGAGAGGNIFIDPTFVILENSRIFANAFGGPGGNIQIFATYFLNTLNSLVDASSAEGVPGTVQISSPNSNLSTQIKVLPATFFDASALVREACASRYASGRGTSSLVGVGRGGLAASPERSAASTYFGDAPAMASGAAQSSAHATGLRPVTLRQARLAAGCAG